MIKLNEKWDEKFYDSYNRNLYYQITPIIYHCKYKTLYVFEDILLLSNLDVIKIEIYKIIQMSNPKIELDTFFPKEKISQLPDWLKNLIIL